jgi:antitoxin (DNA-binding transcriptional repressor) of toxin-antitoxin stability system
MRETNVVELRKRIKYYFDAVESGEVVRVYRIGKPIVGHDHRFDHHVGATSSRDGAHRKLSPAHIAAGSRSYSSFHFRCFIPKRPKR